MRDLRYNMLELFATIILFGSVSGIAVIIFRKIPVLVKLPSLEEKERENLFLKTKEKIKTINPFQEFTFRNFLQKMLLRIRILALKIENRVSGSLEKLRQKEGLKDNSPFIGKDGDNYWQEIKKTQNAKFKVQNHNSKRKTHKRKVKKVLE